ncbi:MAG: hypothetical protein CFE33_15065 [Pseudorhodobacter sp. PARRP1]|nr:MAG: hypothetical protein CFE33_15065 [Pseudorhodobacter sp. PARRP1]
MAKKPTARASTSGPLQVPVTVLDNLNRDGIAYEDGDVLALPLDDARQLKASGVVEFDEADAEPVEPAQVDSPTT